jgi:hypothetical protein
MPIIQETSIPIIKFTFITDEFERTCGSLTMAAPKIIGVDNKNENLVAPPLVTLMNNPVVIVIPERETPGIIASVWDIPINILVPKVILSISIFLALLRSAEYRRTPITINITAIRIGDLNIVSAFFSNSNPPIAPGTLATARYQNNRPSTLRAFVKPFVISCHQSFQK